MINKLGNDKIEETQKEIDQLGKKIKKSLEKLREMDFSKMPIQEFKKGPREHCHNLKMFETFEIDAEE